MTNRFKKNRKKRGHVSTDHGHIGKHHKHLGGHGNAGGMHHHRTLFDKYHPGYLGKEVKDKATKDNALLINVMQFSYFKVLSRSLLPADKPMVVKAKLVLKNAEKKIKEAGGVVVLTA